MDLFFFFFFVNGFCSFADLQKPQTELDGKACAGVGQSSLMAYYETMFDQVIFPLLSNSRLLCKTSKY